MRDVKLRIVGIPFEDSDEKQDVKVTYLPHLAEGTVLDYLPARIRDKAGLRVLLDGQFVAPERWAARKVWPGAEVAVVLEPGDPISLGLGFAGLLIGAGLVVGMPALTAALVDIPDMDSPKSSPTYGDYTLSSLEGPGHPVQIAYGEHLVAGVIIDRRVYSGATGKAAGSFTVHAGSFMTTIIAAFGEGPWHEIAGHTASTGKLYLPENAPTGATLYESDKLRVNGNPVHEFGGKGYVAFRLGRRTQDALPGQVGAVIQKSINTEMALNRAYTYTTTAAVHSLSIVFSHPRGLYYIDSKGRDYPSTFQARVRIKPENATSWTLDETHSITGHFKHQDVTELRVDFERSKNMEPLYGSVVDIEVTPSVNHTNWDKGPQDLWFHSVVEINRDAAPQYPHTVLAEITMEGEGAGGSINTVTALGQCCKVWLEDDLDHEPAFTWTKNPAHILKDYICSLKGGGNEFALENVNRQDFSDWADYCDEWVADGQGGTMRRWECSYVIDGQKGFRDHVAAICATGRAAHYWDGKQLRIAIDKESDPVDTFSVFGHGNIKAGTFKATEIPLDNRPNAVEVTFLDEDQDYVQNKATWKDHDRIRAEGLRLDKVTLYGITTWARAIAAARYLVNVATYRTEAIEFEAFVDGTACRPGQVIAVHHEAEGFDGISGRLVQDTPGGGLGVYLDQPLTITDADQPPRIGVVTSGTGEREFQVRTVVSGAGVYARDALLQVSPSFDAGDLPKQANNYVCGWDAGHGIGPAKPYIVIGMVQKSDLTVQISAVTYDERVYQDDPAGVFPRRVDPGVTRSTIPPVPTKLHAETLPGETIKTTTRAKRIRVSWKNATWKWPVLSWVYVRSLTISEPWGVHRFKAYGEWYDFDNPLDGHEYEIAVSPISADGAFFRAPQKCNSIKIVTGRRAGLLPPRVQ